MRKYTMALFLVALVTGIFVALARTQAGGPGKVEFPTSARSDEAQAHFLRGVAALHSFWYPVAPDEFRAATRIEPKFMMGYWGEAMAHNHPIWGDPQETDARLPEVREAQEFVNRTGAPS
jgi:hypothetical protein